MTVDPNSIDLRAFTAEHLERTEPDLLRSMLSSCVQALMSAEADAICGAPYGERSPERTNSRNGYRTRDFDTRAGSMAVAIAKLREGSYFPDWLLERRRRAERALSQGRPADAARLQSQSRPRAVRLSMHRSSSCDLVGLHETTRAAGQHKIGRRR